MSVLNELRIIMGEEFQMLIDIFVSDSEQRLVAIEQAIVAADAENVRTYTHSLKGSSLNISADQLTELCRRLELMGKEQQLEGAMLLFEEIKIEFIKVKNYLATL